MEKPKKINVVVLGDIIRMCFMKCPVCKIDIILSDDEWSKCKHARNRQHSKKKVVYRLNKDNRSKHGFTQVIEAEVKNFAKLYGIKEMEDEYYGKSR